ncbi:MAG TPA: outer membrane protein assembly factor BamC, partial [Thiolapillus brandeum]|nr:outer membrane protein assembly factor BamC [Thiolapillus brandeum]
KAALSAEKELEGVKSRLFKGRDGVTLRISEPFSRAWRLVGLALDRVGFMVEDRNRSRGVYYVRYNDPMDSGAQEGWLSKLAFWKGEKVDEAALYQVQLESVGNDTQVRIADDQSQDLDNDTALRILTLMKEQLK